MSPQPRTAPAETDADKKAREAREKALAKLTFAESDDAEVGRLLEDAKKLDDEKESLFARITANRELVRNYLKIGRASADQADAALTFYPPREVTRKAKNA